MEAYSHNLVCVWEGGEGAARLNLINRSLFHYVLQIFAQSVTRHNNIKFTSIFSVSHDMYTLHDDTSISIFFSIYRPALPPTLKNTGLILIPNQRLRSTARRLLWDVLRQIIKLKKRTKRTRDDDKHDGTRGDRPRKKKMSNLWLLLWRRDRLKQNSGSQTFS